MTSCLHALFFHHNNRNVGKCGDIASEVQGFPNHLASFSNLWKSMGCTWRRWPHTGDGPGRRPRANRKQRRWWKASYLLCEGEWCYFGYLSWLPWPAIRQRLIILQWVAGSFYMNTCHLLLSQKYFHYWHCFIFPVVYCCKILFSLSQHFAHLRKRKCWKKLADVTSWLDALNIGSLKGSFQKNPEHYFHAQKNSR